MATKGLLPTAQPTPCMAFRPGQFRMPNERYYQFLIWRAILHKWHAEVEKERWDLTVVADGARHVFEMKRWFSEAGFREIPGIRRDIAKLGLLPHGYMLIFSANPPKDTDTQLKWLEDKLQGIEKASLVDYRLPTFNGLGNAIEFWVAGWPVVNNGGADSLQWLPS